MRESRKPTHAVRALRVTRLRSVLRLGSALVLAFAGCATAATTGGSSGGGGGDAAAAPMYDACSAGMPCAPGKTCVNGLCASGCNSDSDCGAGQYCALSAGQVCTDVTEVACPATPCAATQVCVGGLCGTEPTGMQCGASPFGGDGCMNNALCLGNIVVDGKLQTSSICYELPTCSPTHPCTPGGAGALCSTGVIMGKDGLCIPGGCATDQDCPASWTCVPPVGMMGYGECTDGASGQPCGSASDCKAGLTCYIPVQNMLGTCK